MNGAGLWWINRRTDLMSTSVQTTVKDINNQIEKHDKKKQDSKGIFFKIKTIYILKCFS